MTQAFYDDNGITIDGHTDLSFTEDVGKRFEGYGWQVLPERVKTWYSGVSCAQDCQDCGDSL